MEDALEVLLFLLVGGGTLVLLAITERLLAGDGAPKRSAPPPVEE